MYISLVSIHHSDEWLIEKIVGKKLPYSDVPPLASLTAMFTDFFSSHLNLQFRQKLA